MVPALGNGFPTIDLKRLTLYRAVPVFENGSQLKIVRVVVLLFAFYVYFHRVVPVFGDGLP